MKKQVFIATINPECDNNLDLGSGSNKARWNDYCKDRKGKQVRISEKDTKRTLPQNNLFWLYLELIETETGNSTRYMHQYVKTHLTPKVEMSVKLFENSQWVEHKGMAGKGTSECSKQEMSDVMDKLCALTHVPIPDTSWVEEAELL